LTAVKFPHFRETLAKNSKLTTFKQLSFFNAKFSLPFGSAEVLPHSSGNAFINSEAKASVKLPRLNRCFLFQQLARDKSVALTFINASPLDSHRNICRAERKFFFLVKKTQLFERSEF